MRNLVMLLVTAFIGVSTLLFGLDTAHADWAHRFVVNEGKKYIVTDEPVAAGLVGDQVGKVTKYSDREGTYSGNFSNHFPKGTSYYAIRDLGQKEAIAVKAADGTFVKATYDGYYAGAGIWYDWVKLLLYVFGAILLATAIVAHVKRR
ncbi:hypothetical protein FHS18_003945 [Paenibacillus phyllosphaerae]|uniref:Uncharacterized protein n=1 Tax=Paenibacillus phyllosphaerae TaxID=274593 RepID=A0A7W5AZY6_9BACL|nr:hypothetical protein [Paenibacillus phyllosphaerae]MBB3111877.1 hypothetical protein [Paenibacillus phyllosphaerae]